MADEIVVVTTEAVEAAQETAIEAVADEIAEKVQQKLDEDEDETKWVVDLFQSEIAPLRNEVNNLTLQISAILTRVPDQESYNRLQETLARILEAKLIAESVTPNPTPEAIVIAEPTPEPTLEPVSAEDAEKEVKTEPIKKRRRL